MSAETHPFIVSRTYARPNGAQPRNVGTRARTLRAARDLARQIHADTGSEVCVFGRTDRCLLRLRGVA